jgi:hypothetical protein
MKAKKRILVVYTERSFRFLDKNHFGKGQESLDFLPFTKMILALDAQG